MPNANARTKRERGDTDRSLGDERSKTDAELAKRRALVEQAADAAVELAQRRADDVLATARGRADDRLEQSAMTDADRSAVARERAAEDVTLAAERAAAREQLRLERGDTAALVAKLLLRERRETDNHLATERTGADEIVAGRDDFLGIVSHDLRTLLQAVAMSAYLIQNEAGESAANARIREEVLRTQRSVGRMDRLLADLLDFVAIDAGKLRVAPADGDAVKLVRETADAFAQLAASEGIELSTEVGEHCVRAWLDRDRIVQVLANLIGNALKFTERGGRITVAVRAVQDAVEFSVRDTGRGIDGDRLATIFDRFAQASSDRRGHGLGLYISRSIVEAHGGRIWAESRVGEGTRIAFTVPVTSKAR